MGRRTPDVGTSGLHRRPQGPPLIGLLAPLVDWWQERHLALMAEAGFDDVRGAHDAVLRYLPEEGARLTDLAATVGLTKQAMAELVDDLVAKGYVAKTPDPTDGRAKLIVWADRGRDAHEATMAAFERIEGELVEAVGSDAVDQARTGLMALYRATHA